MESILEKITSKTTDLNSEKEVFKKYVDILRYFVKDNINMMVDAIFELQEFCFTKEVPKGFGERWFGLFVDFGIVNRKAVYAWEEDKDDRTPGKTELTNQVSRYIQNLRSKKNMQTVMKLHSRFIELKR